MAFILSRLFRRLVSGAWVNCCPRLTDSWAPRSRNRQTWFHWGERWLKMWLRGGWRRVRDQQSDRTVCYVKRCTSFRLISLQWAHCRKSIPALVLLSRKQRFHRLSSNRLCTPRCTMQFLDVRHRQSSSRFFGLYCRYNIFRHLRSCSFWRHHPSKRFRKKHLGLLGSILWNQRHP